MKERIYPKGGIHFALVTFFLIYALGLVHRL